MISFSNINKQYGKQLLFVDASFQLNPGEKVGLVCPNGSGKTTLFRMVVGEETPDEGAVSVPKKLTIGCFRQDAEEMQGRSVLDEAIAGSGRVGDRSTGGSATKTHATCACFHHDGPVRQRLGVGLGQAQSQSPNRATPLAKVCRSADLHSINKGNCVAVPPI
jgi:energy-coupling factor transporter ATP-binding protein EcfA2